MNKQTLIKLMANKLDMSQQQTKIVLNAIINGLTQAYKEGEKVYLPQFGTFELRYHLPKMGRNPITGEPIEINGANQPCFKASPILKKSLNASRNSAN